MGEALGCLHYEKGAGGANSDRRVSERRLLQPLQPLSEPLGGGKMCLSPFSLLPQKGEAVKQMIRLNRWSQ